MTRIFLWAVLLAASLPAQEPVADSSIEGTVINEVTREPVSKAQVTMVPGNGPPAVTDANGQFAFRNLAPGTYMLHAQHPEFPLMVSGLVAVDPFSVTLPAHEKKSGVVLALTPGASISGRVTDEEGKPVTGCSIQALQFAPGPPGNILRGTRSATSDDRGEYRISGLGSGRYYVSAQCNQTLPAAHGLSQRAPDADLPEQRYATQFYPDSADPAGASRLMAAAGMGVTGIDFHLHATTTVPVRGRVSGDADALSAGPRVELVARDPALGGMVRFPASVSPQTGTFRIPAVPAGAYTLVASAQDQRHVYQGSLPLDIGADAPDPIDLPLVPGGAFSGTIAIEGDPPKPALERLRIRLTPLDTEISGRAPEAKVEADGTFLLSGVLAGRWCLRVDSAQTYVKSLSVGGQETHSCVFHVAPGAGGPMRVVASTKLGQVEGAVNGLQLQQGESALLVLAPEDPEAAQIRAIRASPGGRFRLSGIEPGRYRLYAAAGNEGVALQQSSRVLQALEGRAARVNLEAGGRVTVQVDLIGRDEIRQAFQDVE